MVQGNLDNILSNGAEAYNLNKKDPKNWPQYYGTAFRAPTKALDGAQPVYRVYNSSATWHDYMLEAGKKDKEAKNPGKVTVESIAFYAWPDGKRTGTVPVYRLTQSGSTTKVIFTTDRAWRDKLVAADVNNKDGWKDGGIPFYAFPPAYQAIASNGKPQANLYDCSIKENFVSDRCTAARNNVATAVKDGNIAASNSCPATLTAYINEPFPSRFPKACQDKWNKESSNCSIKENFASDRCRDARAAFEKAEKERIARENAERTTNNRQSNESGARGSSSASTGGRSGTSGGSGSGTRTPPNCNTRAGQRTKYCRDFFAAVDRNNAAGLAAGAALARELSQNCSFVGCGTSGRTSGRSWIIGNYKCEIRGQEKVREEKGFIWKSVTLRRDFTVGGSNEWEIQRKGKNYCSDWKTQINRADRYRSMVIISF